MASFTRADYQAIFNFAKEMYFLHESSGTIHSIKAALIMDQIEGVIGQQSSFPREARECLDDMRNNYLTKLWGKMGRE